MPCCLVCASDATKTALTCRPPQDTSEGILWWPVLATLAVVPSGVVGFVSFHGSVTSNECSNEVEFGRCGGNVPQTILNGMLGLLGHFIPPP